MKRFVAIDIETTGLDHKTANIIEIAAATFDQLGEVENTFSTLVNDGGVIVPEEITQLTGITTEMLNAPESAAYTTREALEEVMRRLTPRTEDEPQALIVAHNASFDMRFIRHNGTILGFDFEAFEVVDTLKISRRLFPGLVLGHSLSNMCSVLGVKQGEAHRALGDALACGRLYAALCKREEEMQALGLPTERSRGRNRHGK